MSQAYVKKEKREYRENTNSCQGESSLDLESRSQAYVKKEKREYRENTNSCQGESSLDLESRRLPKFNRDLLVPRYICDNAFTKIRSVFPEIRAKSWKNSPSRKAEQSFKKFLDPYLDVDDLQNLIISSSLFTDTCISPVRFSQRSSQ